MLRSTLAILGGLAALPLLAFPPAASAAPSTVGGCYYPNVSVSIFEANFFGDIVISNDPGSRKDQCRDFLKGCTNTIRHVTQCVESGHAATENAAFESCTQIADPQDRALCKDNLKAAAKSFEANLDENKSGAKQQCSDCYEKCLAGLSCLIQE